MRRPAAAGSTAPEQRQRGAHRGGIGVVALVDDGERAAGARQREARAAPLLRRESGERRRRAGDVGAQRLAGEQHAERVLGHVQPRRAEDELEFAAEDARANARAAVDRRDLDKLRVAGGVGAEGHDPRGARPAPRRRAARTAARRD